MELMINPNIVFFWRGSHFVCDDFVRHKQWSLRPAFLPLIHSFSMGRSVDSNLINELTKQFKDRLTNEDIKHLIGQFIKLGILVPKEVTQDTAWDEWGIATKYFHYYTRKLGNDIFLSSIDDFERLSTKTTISPQPALYKIYKSNLKEVALSLPLDVNPIAFTEILTSRQTIRTFDPKQSITKEALSTILYYVFGELSCLIDQGIGKIIYRTSPSGGGRHSIEAYVCVLNVNGVRSGLYHYSVRKHALELLKQGDFRDELIFLCGDQPHVSLPAVVVFYTSLLERVKWKYDDPRVYRAIYIELGHFSQTLYLTANWLGLGAFFLAQFRDELVERFLEIDPNHEIPIGVSGFGALTDQVKKYGRFVREDVLSQETL
jgi:SagB-type dehydrogenase family enzyme